MINQKPIVFKKLNELKTDKTVKQVCEEGYQDWAKLPCITYLELQNEPSENADDEEYSSALAIKVDVWIEKESTSDISMKVVSKMKQLGYIRTLYLDVNDRSKIKHKTMRFEKEEILEDEF